jgi:ankyrin repeat protein
MLRQGDNCPILALGYFIERDPESANALVGLISTSDLNRQDKDGSTPLMLAARFREHQIVKSLEESFAKSANP